MLNADGSLTFTPSANFNGTAGFDYYVGDGQGGIDTGDVTVTVNPVQDDPDDAGASFGADLRVGAGRFHAHPRLLRSARSSRLSSLPDWLRGSSATKSTRLGTL